ncbi:MAG: histidine kinase [Bacteroidia bacterium]
MSQQSYHQFMVLHDSLSAARTLRNMARIYTAQGDLNRARIALGDATEILREKESLPLRVMVHADLAEIDLWEGKPKLAIKALEALIPQLDSFAETSQRIHLLQMSSIALAADQRYKESFSQFFRAYHLRQLMDLKEHASIYLYDQFLEADRDRRLFEGRLALVDEQKHSQRVMFVSIIIGLALLLLLSLQALRNTRKLKEAERIRFELESRAKSVELLVEAHELRAIKGAIEAADKERERIALDLHDSAGARITQVAFAISRLKEEVAAVHPSAVDMVDDVIRDIENMNREIRAVSHNLRSPTLQQFGLVTTLEGMRDAIVKSGQLRFELDFHGLQERMEFDIENALHLIVKELLNNAIRHGHAEEFSVSVIREEAAVLMIVEDDGLGFDAKDQSLRRGNGLQSIEKRIRSLHGTLDIDSQPGRGSIFNISIPTV